MVTLVGKRTENKAEANTFLMCTTFICDKDEDKFSR